MRQPLVHLLRRSIALKLTLTLVGFVAVAVTFAGLYLDQALETFAVEALESRLTTAGALLHDEARGLLAGPASAPAVRAFAVRAAEPSRARVTLVAADGRVLGDSEVPVADLQRVESHGDRPEVRAALDGRIGRHVRRSATVNAPLLYVALPVAEGGRVLGVLRFAFPLSLVTDSYAVVHRAMLAGTAVALVVALGIGLFVARRVTKPVVDMHAIARRMSEGDFTARASVRSPDEIGQLGRALNVMSARLREKLGDLEHEQGKVAAILDGMVEGVIAVDGRDHVVLMNERARAICGLGTARAERKPFLEVIRNAELHQLLRASRAAGEGVVSRRELTLAGPVDRTLQATAVPLQLGADEVGALMVLHDVTELRRLEQVRTEFVANVSHELRTPLTAIRGYLETLLGGALEEPAHARRFLEIAARHTERLGRLLDDLTDLSNIELGRVTLRLEPTALGDTVESVLAIVRPRAEAGGVVLAAAVPPDLPPVHADHDRLVQVLLNLVDNAVKYTPQGGSVTVTAHAGGEPGVEITVRDTGVGIPASDLPRITERFYRVDRARSRELGGTGLGLAIVKHLVLAHGGGLAITSEVGQGTTVRVTLPVA
ncbi:MAG TPA: ATP-binding protein [Methylomirabilota bacterium]|nr:ATP-binding protein [Methylomirabilota bacterium]